jgi:hypothetical protein
MPRRELRSGEQVTEWLSSLGSILREPGNLILIGSAALLWHAQDRRLPNELPDASMDVDPITDSDEIARHCYDCLIVVPKLRRGEPRDKAHYAWARHVGLISNEIEVEPKRRL